MSAPIDHRQVQGDIALVAYASEGTISNVTLDQPFAALDGTWNTHYQNGSEVTLTAANEATISESGWYEIAGAVLLDAAANEFVGAAITHNGLLVQLAATMGTAQDLDSPDVAIAHREFKMGGFSGGRAGVLSVLWSGYAQAGDTFEIAIAAFEVVE